MFKKILSFVLSAIMIFSCLPMILFTASAADELTATFMDGDTVIQTITFTSGSQVTTPQYDRIKEGYIFLNWSYNDGKNNKTVSAGSKSSALSTDTVFTAVWAPRNAESTVYSETEVDGVYTWKYDIQKATKLQDTLPVNGSTNANSLSSNVSSSIAPNTKGINLKPGRLWEDTIMLKSFNEVIYSFRVQTTNGCGMAVYINGTKALEYKGQKLNGVAVNTFSTITIKVNPLTGEVTYLSPADVLHTSAGEDADGNPILGIPVAYSFKLSSGQTVPLNTDHSMNFKIVSVGGSNNYLMNFSAQQDVSSNQIVEYDATFEGDGISIAPITTYLKSFVLPGAPLRDGYVFSGWSDGTKVYDPGTAVTLTADTTFTAVWVAGNSYTASFTGIGAEGIENAYSNVDGEIVLPGALTSNTRYFVGWSDGVNTYEADSIVTITANTVFTAVWQEYAASFTGTGAPDVMYADNAKFTLPDPAGTNGSNHFIGWKYDGTIHTVGTTLTLKGDTTFEAVWQSEVYFYSVDDDVVTWHYKFSNLRNGMTPELVCRNGGSVYNYSVNASNYINLKSGGYWYDYVDLNNDTEDISIYIRVGTGDPGHHAISINDTVIITLDDTYTKYTQYGYNIYIDIDNKTLTVNNGDPIAFDVDKIVADQGFKIKHEVGSKGGRLYEVKVTQNFPPRYYASFTGDSINEGDIEDIRSEYYGALTLPAFVYRMGYDLTGWTDGTNTYLPGATVILEADTVFTAVWTENGTPKYYTASFDCGDDSILIDSIDTYTGTITLPAALSRENFIFVGWSDGVTTYSAGAKIIITGDTAFNAVWRECSATFAGTGAPTDVIYAVNKQVVLPDACTTNGSKSFIGWSDGKTIYPVGATVTLLSDTIFHSIWQTKIYSSAVTDVTASWNYEFSTITNGASIGLCAPNGGSMSGFKINSNGYLAFEGEGYWYDYLALYSATNALTLNVSLYVDQVGVQTFSIGDTAVITLDASNSKAGTKYDYTIVVALDEMTASVNGAEPVAFSAPELSENKLKLGYNVSNGGGLYDISATQTTDCNVWVEGYQKTNVNDGKYNIRFVLGVAEIVKGQKYIGIDISASGDGVSKFWSSKTNTVYHSITANFGTTSVTAESINAQYITAVAIANIPEEFTNLTFTLSPYIIVNGEKVYGQTKTLAFGDVYSVVYDPNLVSPDQAVDLYNEISKNVGAGLKLSTAASFQGGRQIYVAKISHYPDKYGWTVEGTTITLYYGALVPFEVLADAFASSVDEMSDLHTLASAEFSTDGIEYLSMATKYDYNDNTVDMLNAVLNRRTDEILATPNMDISHITGTIYYISENGDDSNDGLSPETPWKTLDKLSVAPLKSGDAVLFERGGLYRGTIRGVKGVTYASYGTGNKPILCGSSQNYAGIWERVEDRDNVWKLDMKGLIDPGIIVFYEKTSQLYNIGNDYYLHTGSRVFDSGTMFYTYDNEASPELVHGYLALDKNFEFYYGEPDLDKDSYNKLSNEYTLYVYYDGDLNADFEDIEIGEDIHQFNVTGVDNVTIDGLCFKHTGGHSVRGGQDRTDGLTVRNCVFAYSGGSVLKDRNLRYGNAVEIYGSGVDITVQNNWMYQIFDTAFTMQYSGATIHTDMYWQNVDVSNNVMERCYWGMELWCHPEPGRTVYASNIKITDNIIGKIGNFWGVYQHQSAVGGCAVYLGDMNVPDERLTEKPVVFENNIFDRTYIENFVPIQDKIHQYTRMFKIHYDGVSKDSFHKFFEFKNNYYIQYAKELFALYNGDGNTYYNAHSGEKYNPNAEKKWSDFFKLFSVEDMSGSKVCVIYE